jgi:hypothetical protein
VALTISLPTAVGSPADRLDTLPEGFPDLTLGFWIARWIETELRQPNGKRARKPFELTKRQLRFLVWWYAVNEDGEWLYQHGTRRLAKGSGKSPFAAVVAHAEFCGPVRLKDFDASLPGGCVGQAMDMPLVQIAATAESQTANTMRMVRAFAPKGSAYCERYKLDPGKTRYYKQPEGTLEVITASFTAAEGAESSFVVADETEHWTATNQGTQLAATLHDNLAKSGSRLLETSNAWQPGVDSVAEKTWEAWLAQEEGRTRGDGAILYDAVIAPYDTDLADETSLEAALRFVYDDCWWQDVRPIIKRIWSPTSAPDESRRKYLNQPTAGEDAWTTPAAWAALTNRERIIDPEEPVVLFFDGSKSQDATALVGCTVNDGHVFTLGVWEPAKDRVVDVHDVNLRVATVFDTLNVVAFFADVREWESFVKIDWPRDYGDRLELDAVPSGRDPQKIAWDMRGHVRDFTTAAELTLAEIEIGEFTHDGDSRLARHVGNARRRPNSYGVSVGKESPASTKKIDACVAMIGARMVRRLVIAAGAGKKKRSGVIW